MLDLLLKGVNVLLKKAKMTESIKQANNKELQNLIDSETNVLFKFAHHNVIKI